MKTVPKPSRSWLDSVNTLVRKVTPMGAMRSIMAQGGSGERAARSKSADGKANADPYRLGSRFVQRQASVFPKALKEIQSGKKTSHWMWYVIPTPPYVVGGVERGSGQNSLYALRDLPPNDLVGFDAAKAYLQYPEEQGVSLRRNYLEIISAVGDQLEKGTSLVSLMGFLDDPKLRSSVRLFEFVSREDPELQDVNAACMRVLKILKMEPMPPAKEKKSPSNPAKVETAVEVETEEGKDDAEEGKDDADKTAAVVAEQLEKMRLDRMKLTEDL